MAQQLTNKMDRFAEAVLPALFVLIPNSAKIMATSGCVCIRFIIQVSCDDDMICSVQACLFFYRVYIARS